jgi:hypothetical protein
MSTIKSTYLQHPSASNPNITLSNAGTTTFNGAVVGTGLDFITSASLDGASVVNLNSVFSSRYDNYLAMVTLLNSADSDLFFRMRNAGTTDSSANYDFQFLTVDGTSILSNRTTNTTGGRVGPARSSTYGICSSTLWIYGPYLAQNTLVCGGGFDSVGEAMFNDGRARHQVNGSYDSLALYPGSGYFVSGTVRLYGYNNS